MKLFCSASASFVVCDSVDSLENIQDIVKDEIKAKYDNNFFGDNVLYYAFTCGVIFDEANIVF